MNTAKDNFLKKYIKDRIDNTRAVNKRIKEKSNPSHWDNEMFIYNDGQIECLLEVLEKINWIEKAKIE